MMKPSPFVYISVIFAKLSVGLATRMMRLGFTARLAHKSRMRTKKVLALISFDRPSRADRPESDGRGAQTSGSPNDETHLSLSVPLSRCQRGDDRLRVGERRRTSRVLSGDGLWQDYIVGRSAL